MVREGLRQRFASALESLGGSAGNGKPQAELGGAQVPPSEPEYGRMSDELIQSFASVWDALADTPEQAANMRLRAELALAIQAAVEGWGDNRAGAAELLRVTQPHLAELLEGRLDLFSVDELATLAERVGLTVEMRIAHAAA